MVRKSQGRKAIRTLAARAANVGSVFAIHPRFQPKQADLYEMLVGKKGQPPIDATWIGYGGSRGGAKSYALRNIILAVALSQPGIRCCILRRTYKLVKENHLDPMMAEFPILRQFYHVGDAELRLPGNSVVVFKYAENQSDVEGMIGTEYKYFGVDQAEAFTEKELLIMRSCVRWPNSAPSDVKFILTFNPGGMGHAFLKRVFYDHKYLVTERPNDYRFIQAFGWDNVQWALPMLVDEGKNESDYYRMSEDERYKLFIERTDYGRYLNSLPPAMKIGWLMGRMDKFSGQYYDLWAEERFVKEQELEEWSPRWVGIDWGFAHPSAILWGAAQKSGVYVYREMLKRGLSPQALAQEIAARTPIEERKQVKAIWLSHDAFAKRDERDSIADQMGKVFVQNGLPYPTSAGRTPEADAALIYDLLRGDLLQISPNCSDLIETIPMITRDDKQPEKPVKFDAGEKSLGDDAFDALRHLVKGRMGGKKKPAEQAAREQAAWITDPIARWLFLTQAKRRMQAQTEGFQPNIQPSWIIDSKR